MTEVGNEHPAAARHDGLRRVAPAVQHDINNAMMVLTSNLDLLARTATDAAPRRQLDRALQAVKRLEETMRGFLDAARREVADATVVSPLAVLRQVLPLVRVALGARFTAQLVAPDRVSPVSIDRARLDLALLALAQEVTARMPHGSCLNMVLAEGEDVTLTLAAPQDVVEAALPRFQGLGRVEVLADGIVVTWVKTPSNAC